MSNTMSDMPMMDPLDEKLTAHFPGRVVRKDLVRQTKAGFNVPIYVLEYLLGKSCSSTDPEIIISGGQTTVAQLFIHLGTGRIDLVGLWLELALEGRRRVKEQLKKMGGLEYWAVNFSYLDNETRQETFVTVPEQGGGGLILPGQGRHQRCYS